MYLVQVYPLQWYVAQGVQLPLPSLKKGSCSKVSSAGVKSDLLCTGTAPQAKPTPTKPVTS